MRPEQHFHIVATDFQHDQIALLQPLGFGQQHFGLTRGLTADPCRER